MHGTTRKGGTVSKKTCPQCNGKGVLGSCLDMIGDSNPDECPTCEGCGVIPGLTISEAVTVPEVRALVEESVCNAKELAAEWGANDIDGESVEFEGGRMFINDYERLAPFLAAMEKRHE